MKEYNFIKDFTLWDKIHEFSADEAACLAYKVDPPDYPHNHLLPHEIKRKIDLTREILCNAAKKGELRWHIGSREWGMQVELYKRADLKTYAKEKNGFGFLPEFLFPEERAENQKGSSANWFIKDYAKWDLKDEFSLNEAAHLYYEVDPDNTENLPTELSVKISEMFNYLSEAAKTGVLYEPAFRDGTKLRRGIHKASILPGDISHILKPSDLMKKGVAYRADYEYFFSERRRQKPKFLFPEERQEQRPQWLQEDSIYPKSDGYGGLGVIRIPVRAFWETLPKSINYNFIREKTTLINTQNEPGQAFKHNPDYTWVSLSGQEFNLTPDKAKLIQVLHQAYSEGCPILSKKDTMTKAGLKGRFTDLFKTDRKMKQALIVESNNGRSCSLNI